MTTIAQKYNGIQLINPSTKFIWLNCKKKIKQQDERILNSLSDSWRRAREREWSHFQLPNSCDSSVILLVHCFSRPKAKLVFTSMSIREPSYFFFAVVLSLWFVESKNCLDLFVNHAIVTWNIQQRDDDTLWTANRLSLSFNNMYISTRLKSENARWDTIAEQWTA